VPCVSSDARICPLKMVSSASWLPLVMVRGVVSLIVSSSTNHFPCVSL